MYSVANSYFAKCVCTDVLQKNESEVKLNRVIKRIRNNRNKTEHMFLLFRFVPFIRNVRTYVTYG
jgi:hypothetical protein